MTKHITIRLSVATDSLDSACVDEITISRTEWDDMTQQQQYDFVQEAWDDHKSSYLHGAYWVIDEAGNTLPDPTPEKQPTHFLVKVRTTVGELAFDAAKLVQADTADAAIQLAILAEARSEVGQGANWEDDTLYDLAGTVAYSCKGVQRVEAGDLLALKKHL